ncbi:MAG TPA: electron transfer flavoprotein subunit beta/FixA family protein [Solirubrobacteraceae bacterium]|jgi:electron transfer flavoprotein beta subunit|nr:electron transfer flavoprotein subunit beta/FixA family protein [Solirubrobacteraceae bacterium]
MKILVAVKQVAQLRDDFVPPAAGADDGAVVLSAGALQWSANDWDAFSLEAALALRDGALRDRRDDVEVVAVTVGDERSEPALRAALAIGAERAIRVWDEALDVTSDGADPLSVARLLAAVAEAESPQLILCGAQSADMANAATGVALAGLLDYAHVAVVSAIERDGEQLTVQRELEDGAVELLRISLPVLLTVQTGINAPRRPNLRAIKHARAADLTVLGLDELGLDGDAPATAAGARTAGLYARPAGGAETLEGSPAEIAASIAAIVGKALGS